MQTNPFDAKSALEKLSSDIEQDLLDSLDYFTSLNELNYDIAFEITQKLNLMKFTLTYFNNEKVISKWIDLLIAMSSILKDKFIPNFNCGSCFITVCLLLVIKFPSFEKQIWSLITSTFADSEGYLIERHSFYQFANQTSLNFNSSYLDTEKEICKGLVKGPWKDNIMGLGRLITSSHFVSLCAIDSKRVNGLLENFISSYGLSYDTIGLFLDMEEVKNFETNIEK